MSADRHHFVFTYPCGCPFGLVEQADRRQTEDSAWKSMYETRTKERVAVARGVRVEFADHDTYTEKYFPLMSVDCPHRAEER